MSSHQNVDQSTSGGDTNTFDSWTHDQSGRPTAHEAGTSEDIEPYEQRMYHMEEAAENREIRGRGRKEAEKWKRAHADGFLGAPSLVKEGIYTADEYGSRFGRETLQRHFPKVHDKLFSGTGGPSAGGTSSQDHNQGGTENSGSSSHVRTEDAGTATSNANRTDTTWSGATLQGK